MFSFGTARKLLQTFAKNQAGSFVVAFAGASAVLVLAMGYAINIGQIYNAKSALLAALDTAVTSTARDITTGRITKEEAPDMVRAFLLANSQNSLLRGKDVQIADLEISDAARTVSATAVVDLPMFFPVFEDGDTRRVRVESAAVYSDKKIEVVMMLDVTGSMKDKDKIGALKKAASNAVDSFFAMQDKKKTRIRMAMVPYSTSVNAGSLAATSVFVERAPGDRRQAKGNLAPRAVSGKPRPDSCATERKGDFALSDAGPDRSMVNRDFWLTASDGVKCPSVAVVPLTTDAGSIKNQIRSFKAAGTTAGHIGIQWSWYLLSDQWNSVLAQPSRPSPYNSKESRKIAILMTDGLFNVEYSGAANETEIFKDHPDSAPALRSKKTAKALCSAMKARGIEIFTIGFDLKSKAKDVMKDCASEDIGSIRHYFEAANGKELDAAFQTIAGNVERLALTR